MPNVPMFKFSEWLDSWFNLPYSVRIIMAKQDELRTQIADLQAALDAEQEQIKAAIDALTAQIAELRANPDIASDITDSLAAIRDDLAGTISDAEPEPEPEPEPPTP